jgi:butyryl-CoA dehydrogenase
VPNSCSITTESAADRLIGGTEGRGFQQAVGGLELGRINVAARGAGIAEGALRAAVRYAQERQTFGKPIAQHQAIQLKLADMATRVEAAKLLIAQAAAKSTPASAATSRPAWPNCSPRKPASKIRLEAMRIFGGYSYSTDFDVERYYRDAPLMCIGEGTNEMQRIIIARQLLEQGIRHEPVGFATHRGAHPHFRKLRCRTVRLDVPAPISAPR